ncbi:hypothetical protein ALQ30_200666 [Pseudomonas syringae pv. persicae]|uniref:Uncharacterized protein n=1 Tax=Pseudomonas syringae pv. persicae TaxID=237306 RepID=A0A3M4ALW5_9PSED|nr:hypothetical protein ALQ30_200666 [Pseudomonas syringae pv. persicae]
MDIVVLQVRVTTWPDREVNYPVRLVYVLENVWIETFCYSESVNKGNHLCTIP